MGIAQSSGLRTWVTMIGLLVCAQMSVKLDEIPDLTCSVIKFFSGSLPITGLDRADDLRLGDGRFTVRH